MSAHEFDDTSVCSDGLSLSLQIDNRSSYGGIHSNLNDEQSNTDCSLNNDEKKKGKKKNKKNETQPVTFEWEKEENDTVYLTGSFCNWKQFFIMPKNDNMYKLTLPLPKALHKFKFRINDIFFTNKKYPIMKDGDNNCNYIDTSSNKQSSLKSSKIKFSDDESESDKKSDKDSHISD